VSPIHNATIVFGCVCGSGLPRGRTLVLCACLAVVLTSCGNRSPRPRPGPAAPRVLVYPCEPRTRGITVDGRLEDWGDRVWMPIRSQAQAGWRKEWRGPSDFSAFLALLWDERYLYAAVRVKDSHVYSRLTSAQSGGDALDMTLASRGWLRSPRREFELNPRFVARAEVFAIVRRADGPRIVGLNSPPVMAAARQPNLSLGPGGLPFHNRIDLASPAWEINHAGNGWGRLEEVQAGGTAQDADKVLARWAAFMRTTLHFVCFEHRDVLLRVRAAPFRYPGDKPQVATVLLNGHAIGSLPPPSAALQGVTSERWLGFADFVLHVPADCLVPGRNELAFRFRRAIAPNQVDPDSNDRRPRAAAFSSMSLSIARGFSVHDAAADHATHAEAPLPAAVATGDFDGDGDLEILFATAEPTWTPDGEGYAVIGFDPQGRWAWQGAVSDTPWRLVAAADLDGDGLDEVLAAPAPATQIHVFDPDRVAGSLPKDERLDPVDVPGWRHLAAGNMGRDRAVELAGSAGTGIQILKRRSGGYASFARVPLAEECRRLFFADLDADGDDELLAILRSPLSGETCLAAFDWRDGALSPVAFDTAAVLAPGAMPRMPLPPFLDAGTADLDGDGRAELLLLISSAAEGSRILIITPGRSTAPYTLDVAGPEHGTERIERLLCGNFLGRSRGRAPFPGETGMAGPVSAPPPDPEQVPFSWISKTGAVLASRIASVATRNGYEMEACLPWPAIGATPSPGRELDMSLLFHDVDRGGRRSGSPPPATMFRWVAGGADVGRVRLLASSLPDRLGPRQSPFLPALTALDIPFNYLLGASASTGRGDAGDATVCIGARRRRAPRVARFTLTDSRGLVAEARRTRRGEESGCTVERWRFAAYGLADGPVEAKVEWENRAGRPVRSGLYCRTREYEDCARIASNLVADLWARVSAGPAQERASRGDVLFASLWLKADRAHEQVRRVPGARIRAEIDGPRREIEQVQEKVREAAAGKNVWEEERGGLLCGYYSDIDDSVEPFALNVPSSYTGEEPVPLIVHMHGAGMGRFHGHPAPAIKDCLVLSPHGRGWTDYMHTGEDDVRRVLRIVRERYNVDPNRVYLAGSSMGGTGCWHLATRFPDLFAGIAPVCGNCDYRVWDEYWEGPPAEPVPRADLRAFLKSTLSARTFAENLRGVPVLNAHGARDNVVYVEHSRNIVADMRALGYMPMYREHPTAGHGVPGDARVDRWEWLLAQRRATHPRRIRYRTAHPRHAGAHWIRIDRFRRPLRMAAVDALIEPRPTGDPGSANTIVIATENVAALTLDFSRWLVGHDAAPHRGATTDAPHRPVSPRSGANLVKGASFEGPAYGDSRCVWELAGAAAEFVRPPGGQGQAREGRRCLRLTPLVPGKTAYLCQRFAWDEDSAGRYVTAGIWVRAESDEAVRGRLELAAAAEGKSLRRFAGKTFFADAEWQYVIASGRPGDQTEHAALRVFVESDSARPAERQSLVLDDISAVTGRTLPALRMRRGPEARGTNPLDNLVSDEEGPNRTWPWRSVNMVPQGRFAWGGVPAGAGHGVGPPRGWSFLARRACAVSRGQRSPVGGESLRVRPLGERAYLRMRTSPVLLRGKPGRRYLACVAARACPSQARGPGAVPPRIRLGVWRASPGPLPAGTGHVVRSHAVAWTTLSDEWRFLTLPIERGSAEWTSAQPFIVCEPGDSDVLIGGAFILRAAALPDHLMYPDSPDAVDFRRPVRVMVNGETAYDGLWPADRIIRIGAARRGGTRPRLAQRPPLRGPLEDAFRTPFILVYGTHGPDLDRQVSESEARAFLKEWRWRYYSPCRIKADDDVTGADIARCNLVLYGGPSVNRLTARVNEKLPIRIEGNKVTFGRRTFIGADLGVKMVYPNPLNPRRYVAVLAGTTWLGTYQINKRFGNWFGWRIYENRNWFDFAVFDDYTVGPGSFLAVGFFDKSPNPDGDVAWRPAPEATFFGRREVRAKCPPRRAPMLRAAPDGVRRLCLTDLWPTAVDQRFGAIGLDRGFRGNPILLGGKRYRRGLGMRVPSSVTYSIGRGFDLFTAVVGSDLEGRTSVTAERARAERVEFRIYGDGRLLEKSDVLGCGSPPQEIVANVTGVRTLKLVAAASGRGPIWLYGSSAWGLCRLEKMNWKDDDAQPETGPGQHDGETGFAPAKRQQ